MSLDILTQDQRTIARERLSPGELDVLKLQCEGLSNWQIARRMGCSLQYVKDCKRAVRAKMAR